MLVLQHNIVVLGVLPGKYGVLFSLFSPKFVHPDHLYILICYTNIVFRCIQTYYHNVILQAHCHMVLDALPKRCSRLLLFLPIYRYMPALCLSHCESQNSILSQYLWYQVDWIFSIRWIGVYRSCADTKFLLLIFFIFLVLHLKAFKSDLHATVDCNQHTNFSNHNVLTLLSV